MKSIGWTLVRVLALVLALLMIASVALVACNDNDSTDDQTPPCTKHADNNGDGKCDTCDAPCAPACTDHIDTNEDKKCDICNADMSGNGDGGSQTPAGPTEEELAAMGEILKAAYALETGATMDGMHTLVGKVTNVAQTGEDEACLTIVVTGYDDYPIYCYWLKGTDAHTLNVNDVITVTGTIKNYKGTVELDKPTLDAVVKGERPPLVVTTTPGTGIATGYDVITIEMAKEICAYVGEATTTDRYYILATVDTVSNAKFGEMRISDATGDISVYGTYSADGTIGYADMTDKPLKGATVLLSCTLHSFGENAEVQNARLIAFENVVLDETAYADMTVAEARAAADGTLVKIEGVVARITYATGMIPSGVYVVDGTQSIYVYDRDLAARVAIGNKITVLGEKTHWILDTEQASAAKIDYEGCNQIENAWLLANDNGTNTCDFSWVQETTVKDIMNTPFSEDITTSIFKVNALVSEVEGTGFVNYYINDLDEYTGSYVYTQCNGSDFAWLKNFEAGKVYTVYLSVINAKSTPTGGLWRFIPIVIEESDFVANQSDAAKFFVDYFGKDQFESVYHANPALTLNTTVSSNVYNIQNATITYTSGNPDVIAITQVDGVYVMNCISYGTATITVSCTCGGQTYSTTVEVTYEEAAVIPSISVADAITTAPDTEVTVKGIVGPSLVNQDGFYLFGEDGSMIAVKVANKAEAFAGLAIGHEVIVKGMRERYVNDDAAAWAGQTCIVNAVILQNNFGSHDYSTEKFVTDKTVSDLYNLDKAIDYSTTVFVVTGTISFPSGYGQPAINADGVSFGFYSSGSGQYAWLQQFAGQEVTIEIAVCNWNNKNYWRGCVLAVRTEDGKILNTLNFD